MRVTKRQLRKLIREVSENESWWEGYDSASGWKGNGGNENPYPSDSDLSHAWDEGFKRALSTPSQNPLDDDADVSDPQMYSDKY